MPSLKDLKDRISSVKSTQKITKAKKMVAASKLRRAQEAAESARPYAERMEKVLSALGRAVIGTPGAPKLLGGTGSDQTQLVIVATSERGLCGAFNTNIAKAARQHIEQLVAEGKTVKILCIGKKGHTLLKGQFGDKIIDLVDLGSVRKIGFSNGQEIATRVLEMFERGEFDVASMFYSKFQSALAQIPQRQQLIPAPITANDNDASEDDLGGAAYEYEPGEEEILTDLLPRNIAVQVYRALLENVASEQGASMTAMDAATRNAGEMIDQLTLVYNRTRQAAITKELIEIISGAEAL